MWTVLGLLTISIFATRAFPVPNTGLNHSHEVSGDTQLTENTTTSQQGYNGSYTDLGSSGTTNSYSVSSEYATDMTVLLSKLLTEQANDKMASGNQTEVKNTDDVSSTDGETDDMTSEDVWGDMFEVTSNETQLNITGADQNKIENLTQELIIPETYQVYGEGTPMTDIATEAYDEVINETSSDLVRYSEEEFDAESDNYSDSSRHTFNESTDSSLTTLHSKQPATGEDTGREPYQGMNQETNTEVPGDWMDKLVISVTRQLPEKINETSNVSSMVYNLSQGFMDKFEMTQPESHTAYHQCDIEEDHAIYMAVLCDEAKSKGEATHSYYCGSSAVQKAISDGGFTDCSSLTDYILQDPGTNYIPTISQVDYTHLQDDMQEIHRGLISFHSVLTNISALQVNYLCDPLRRAGIPCDHSVIKNQICSSPTQVPDVNFLCELLEQIDDLIHMYGSLEYQHQRMMGHYGLEPEHSFDSIDVNPVQCPDPECGSSLTHYTLAGTYSAMLQAQVGEDMFGYLYASLVNSCH